MVQMMQISDLEGVSFEQHEEFQITLSLCVQFSEHVTKIYFLAWNFLNYSTYILTHFSDIFSINQ